VKDPLYLLKLPAHGPWGTNTQVIAITKWNQCELFVKCPPLQSMGSMRAGKDFKNNMISKRKKKQTIMRADPAESDTKIFLNE
jgi:hypothetical protein